MPLYRFRNSASSAASFSLFVFAAFFSPPLAALDSLVSDPLSLAFASSSARLRSSIGKSSPPFF